MVAILSRLANAVEQSVARLNVQSVLNSTLWLSAVAGLLGLIGTIFTNPPVQYFMVSLMFFGPIAYVFGFVYFSFVDPNKLRSESYELRKTALGMIEEKGGDIPLDITSVEAITNVGYSPQLENKSGDRDQ